MFMLIQKKNVYIQLFIFQEIQFLKLGPVLCAVSFSVAYLITIRSQNFGIFSQISRTWPDVDVFSSGITPRKSLLLCHRTTPFSIPEESRISSHSGSFLFFKIYLFAKSDIETRQEDFQMIYSEKLQQLELRQLKPGYRSSSSFPIWVQDPKAIGCP